MRINKNLDLNGLYKCCRKVCTCNISLKIINDIVKGQNVILLNKITKISMYVCVCVCILIKNWDGPMLPLSIYASVIVQEEVSYAYTFILG